MSYFYPDIIQKTTQKMDGSHLSVSPLPAIDAEVEDEQGAPTSQFSPARQLFFRQLHSMLMNETSNGCIRWLNDSKFSITDKDSFSENVLHRYFGEAKYASFTRRLKRWGFRRITKGTDIGAYYHEGFRRDMNFEAYDDDMISECSPSESSQSRPLKKRMLWSPDPSNEKTSNNSFDSLCYRNVDVSIMPEIMRKINRSKRCERRDHVEASKKKRAKLGYNSFYNAPNHDITNRGFEDRGFASFRHSRCEELPQNDLAYHKRQILEQNQGLNCASFGQPLRRESPQDHLAYLKRQIFEQNQGVGCNLGLPRSTLRRDLSQVSTEILQREIQLRRMNAVPNGSTQMCHQALFGGYNTPNVSRATTSMEFRSYCNYPSPVNSRAMGAVKGSTCHNDMPTTQQKSRKPFDANTGMKDNALDSMKASIPDVDEMEQQKPFSRAA